MERLAESLYSGLELIGNSLDTAKDRLSEEFDSRIRYNPTLRKAYGAAMFSVGTAEFLSTWYTYLNSGKGDGGPITNYLMSNGPMFNYNYLVLAGTLLFHIFGGILPIVSLHGLSNISAGKDP